VVSLILVRLVQIKLNFYAGLALAILLGYLLNPHSLFWDWGTAFVAIMLLRRSGLIPEPYSDFSFGLLAISLVLAGNMAWETRHETGQYLRPLTAWTIVMSCVIVGVMIRSVIASGDRPSRLWARQLMPGRSVSEA
jgi:hypothetical protein